MPDISAEDYLRLAISQRPASAQLSCQLANLLIADGRRSEAVSILREGMMFAQGRDDLLMELADGFIAVDAVPEALQALQAASRLCPGDAELRTRVKALAAQLKNGETATRQLFNQYAAAFDQELAALHYTAPQQIAAMLDPYAAHFVGQRVIDLGCGTGLMGHHLQAASQLIGIDLSPAMLEEAKAKNIYSELIAGDVVAYCQRAQEKATLVTAADVLVYIGDLQPLFTAVATMLAVSGLFIFTVERRQKNGYAANATKRFSHSESYIRQTAQAAGFAILHCENIVPRYDRKKPVDGLMVLLELL